MKEGSSLDGGVTALVWVGPPGGTVLEMRGGEMEVRDLSIIGRPIGAEGRAGIGILVTKPGKGIGSGKHHFPSLHIEDCEIAIQVGQKPTEHNCDNLVFGYLTVTNCGYGLRVMNAMGMGFKFDYVHTRGVGEMFDFWGGGNLWVDAWKIIAGNVGIHIRDEPGFVAIGKNNASYVCNNLKLDANSKEYKLIQQDGNKPALIVLNHGHIANKVSLEKPFIEVGGNTCVTLRDWYNFKIGKIVAHEIDGVKPNILLDRCRLGAFTEPQEFLIGKGYLKLRDCMVGVTTVPVPDVLIEK
ncbi:MAG: hypothetical protein M5U26_27535 [Planctomycetota bacterium]|nr:hypothetical protein [Planctomycetota bacterium]